MIEKMKEHKVITIIIAIVAILIIIGIFVSLKSSDPREVSKSMVESELNRLTKGEASIKDYEFTSVDSNRDQYTVKGVVRFTSMVDYNELTFYADFEVKMTKDSSTSWICDNISLDLRTNQSKPPAKPEA